MLFELYLYYLQIMEKQFFNENEIEDDSDECFLNANIESEN